LTVLPQVDGKLFELFALRGDTGLRDFLGAEALAPLCYTIEV
jgi:hypothetical protein